MELQVDPSQWLDTRANLQGVELDVYQRKGPDGDPIVVAEWPRSGPGFYRLVTQIGEVTSSADIVIRPKKISEESETQIEFLYDRNCADRNFNERIQNFDYRNLKI